MKRILILIVLLLLSVWTASAQGDLQVGAVFDGKVVPATAMKETFIRSSRLETYHLEQYRSVSFTGDDQVLAEVSRRVLADAERATDQEIHMKEGRLAYDDRPGHAGRPQEAFPERAVTAYSGRSEQRRYPLVT